jgi:hypothetical protein
LRCLIEKFIENGRLVRFSSSLRGETSRIKPGPSNPEGIKTESLDTEREVVKGLGIEPGNLLPEEKNMRDVKEVEAEPDMEVMTTFL